MANLEDKNSLKNIEVEVKLRVKDIDKVISWLEKNDAEYLGDKKQVDIYFDPPHKTFIKVLDSGKKVAREYIRIRKSDKGSSVAYKSRAENLKDGEVKWQFTEIETPVEKYDKMFDLFRIIGFKETAVIDKYRRSWKYKDFLFEIDNVKEVGVFVEIEFQGKAESSEDAENKLFDFLDTINIGEYELDNEGLVQLYWNKE